MVFKKKAQELEGVHCYYVGHFFSRLIEWTEKQNKQKKPTLFKVKKKKFIMGSHYISKSNLGL